MLLKCIQQKGDSEPFLKRDENTMQSMILIPSLSGLFGYCARNNTIPEDTSDTVYAFGSTREGIEETLRGYSLPPSRASAVLEMLSNADEEGRVSWRNPVNAMNSEFLAWRTAFLRHHIESRGGVIDMEWSDGQRYASELLIDAAWNLPAMQRFIANCVSNLDIRVLDYAGLQTVDNWRI
jgi:hypothetical protein